MTDAASSLARIQNALARMEGRLRSGLTQDGAGDSREKIVRALAALDVVIARVRDGQG